MSNLMLTLILAFVVIVLAIAALAIGWLITGKAKIEAGSCGRDPTKRPDEDCGRNISCSLCEPPESPKKQPAKEEENDDLSEG